MNVFDYDNQIISGAYIVFACKDDELNPNYLDSLFKSHSFLNYVNDKANGGVRMNFKFEDMELWEIPLPTIEDQTAIVEQIEKQKAIIEGADKVLENSENSFELSDEDISKAQLKSVGDVCSFEYGEPLKESDRVDGEYPVVGAGNIIGYHNRAIHKSPVIVTGRRGATSGKIQWISSDCYVIDTAFYINLFNENEINKRFLFYVLQSLNLQKLQSGGAMPGINRNEAYKEKFYLPDIYTQRKIVAELDAQMQVLEGLHKMKAQAEKRIEKILADVWGVEVAESVIPTNFITTKTFCQPLEQF